MRQHRLLIILNERGSSAAEATFAIVFLMLLVLGVIEIAFALYARNVVSASAHEAARHAVEIGRDPDTARSVARSTVVQAAGGLVDGLTIGVRSSATRGRRSVEVIVSGRMKPFGPVPLPIAFSTTATAVQDLPRR